MNIFQSGLNYDPEMNVPISGYSIAVNGCIYFTRNHLL